MLGIKRPNQGPTVQLCKEQGIVKYGGSCYVEKRETLLQHGLHKRF